MTIVPLIIIIILIYQLSASRLYQNKVEYNSNYLNLVENSLIVNDRNNLENPNTVQILDEMLKDIDLEGQAFYILDENSKPIYFKSGSKDEYENYIEKILEYKFDQNSNHGFISEEAFITYHLDELTNYKYILLTLPKLMNNKIYFIKELVTIIVIVLLISMFSIILISHYLTNPIRKLSKDIERNSIKFDEEVIVKDEIWDISIHLNKIYQELKVQNEIRYYLKMKTNKAQFEALQAQINPHFLYNTLGTINSIAVVEKVPLIAELSKSLANMFRYNISKNSDFVTLKDELNHINNYLNVQLIRLDGMIEKELKVDESLLPCKVVKFMLQPIIENCFNHAFKDLNNEKGILRIGAYRQDHSVIIYVADNGVSFNLEKLDQMNKLLVETEVESTNQQNKGIGLSNVNSRIKLAFGNEYGLSFQGQHTKGLRVIIRLPFEEINEGVENVSGFDC